MRNRKSPWTLLVLVLLGALIGGIGGELLSRYSWFAWIGLGGPNGYRELFSLSLNPLVDTHIVEFGFNLTMRVNAGSLIGMILGILIYVRL